MTITTWPIDAVAAVPGRQLREAHSVYMVGASATDPFGVRSGVRPGTSPTTVTATSTTWTVGAHAGVVDLQPAVEASGYAYAVNATGGLPTGTVDAADLTRPRVDIVWVRNDDPSEGDASPNPTVVFGYTAGVPLAIPVAPATPARCMVLATIQVPMCGGGSPTVIWTAPYTVAAGGVLPVPTGVYPATPYTGQYVDDATLGLLRWNGTAWGRPLAPAVSAKSTTNSAGFYLASTALLNAPSITGDGVKQFKITVHGYAMSSTGANDVFQMQICDSTLGVVITTHQVRMPATAGNVGGFSIATTDVPAAGAHVYQLAGERLSGTGVGTVLGAVTAPIEIIVEQIA